MLRVPPAPGPREPCSNGANSGGISQRKDKASSYRPWKGGGERIWAHRGHLPAHEELSLMMVATVGDCSPCTTCFIAMDSRSTPIPPQAPHGSSLSDMPKDPKLNPNVKQESLKELMIHVEPLRPPPPTCRCPHCPAVSLVTQPGVAGSHTHAHTQPPLTVTTFGTQPPGA